MGRFVPLGAVGIWVKAEEPAAIDHTRADQECNRIASAMFQDRVRTGRGFGCDRKSGEQCFG